MKIAIYDVDSKIPNLALMKISRYHMERGDSVEMYAPLWADSFDKIYASKVFEFSDVSYLDPDRMEIGGTGWDKKVELPTEIEMIDDSVLESFIDVLDECMSKEDYIKTQELEKHRLYIFNMNSICATDAFKNSKLSQKEVRDHLKDSNILVETGKVVSFNKVSKRCIVFKAPK